MAGKRHILPSGYTGIHLHLSGLAGVHPPVWFVDGGDERLMGAFLARNHWNPRNCILQIELWSRGSHRWLLWFTDRLGATRYQFPGRRFFDALSDLPFALPTAVAGIALSF